MVDLGPIVNSYVHLKGVLVVESLSRGCEIWCNGIGRKELAQVVSSFIFLSLDVATVIMIE